MMSSSTTNISTSSLSTTTGNTSASSLRLQQKRRQEQRQRLFEERMMKQQHQFESTTSSTSKSRHRYDQQHEQESGQDSNSSYRGQSARKSSSRRSMQRQHQQQDDEQGAASSRSSSFRSSPKLVLMGNSSNDSNDNDDHHSDTDIKRVTSLDLDDDDDADSLFQDTEEQRLVQEDDDQTNVSRSSRRESQRLISKEKRRNHRDGSESDDDDEDDDDASTTAKVVSFAAEAKAATESSPSPRTMKTLYHNEEVRLPLNLDLLKQTRGGYDDRGVLADDEDDLLTEVTIRREFEKKQRQQQRKLEGSGNDEESSFVGDVLRRTKLRQWLLLKEGGCCPSSSMTRWTKVFMIMALCMLLLLCIFVPISRRNNNIQSYTANSGEDTDKSQGNGGLNVTVPDPPSNLGRICQYGSSEFNLQQCRDVCSKASCCLERDSSKNCFYYNLDSCASYTVCLTLREHKESGGGGDEVTPVDTIPSAPTTTVDAPPSNLADTCRDVTEASTSGSTDLPSLESIQQCQQVCEPSRCCFKEDSNEKPTPDNCYLSEQNHGSCDAYRSICSYLGPTYGGALLEPSSSEDITTPSSESDLSNVCSFDYLLEQGSQMCERQCYRAECCFSHGTDETNGPCYTTNQDLCELYAPCGILKYHKDSSKEVVTLSQTTTTSTTKLPMALSDVNIACREEHLLTNRNDCQLLCEEAQCCWTSDYLNTCVKGQEEICKSYRMCDNLNQIPPPITENDLKTTCHTLSNNLVECKTKCDAANCCIDSDPERNCYSNYKDICDVYLQPCQVINPLFGTMLSGGSGSENDGGGARRRTQDKLLDHHHAKEL